MNRVMGIVQVIIILIAAMGQWYCSNPQKKTEQAAPDSMSSPLVVKVLPVTRREWVLTVPITGNLRSLSSVEVKPEVGGRLIALHFKEGDFVPKGALLAEIDPTNYRLAYDQAVAALRVAEAGLERAMVSAEHARTEKERADNLLRSGGITEKDHQAAVTGVKEAESQVRLAEAQCSQARASLAIAEKALKDCRIFAPAGGHVQRRHYDRGSLVTPGVPLFTLVDNSQLELECVVPSYQLSKIQPGQRAAFKTPAWGERLFEGTVSAINPEVDPENRSVKVKLGIANPKGSLRSGMYAKGEIIVGREPLAILIPRDALIPEKEESGAAAVYVVRDGKAHRVELEIEDRQQDPVLVRKGLEEGDLVITEIGPSLREGTPVKYAQ